MTDDGRFSTYFVLGTSTDEKIEKDFEKYKEHFLDADETFYLFKCIDNHYLLAVNLFWVYTTTTVVYEFPFKREGEHSRAFIDQVVWEGYTYKYAKDAETYLYYADSLAFYGNRLNHDVMMAIECLCNPKRKPVLILSSDDYEPLVSNTKAASKSNISQT